MTTGNLIGAIKLVHFISDERREKTYSTYNTSEREVVIVTVDDVFIVIVIFFIYRV